MNNSVTVSKSITLICWPSFLLDNDQARLKYIFKTSLLVLVIALPLAITLSSLFPNANHVADSFDTSDYIKTAILTLLVAPISETIIMWGILLLIRGFTKRLLATCAISAGFWAVLHGVSFPIQGVVSFFSFFIYSLVFQVWLKKSFSQAFLITTSVHMLNNAFVLVVGFMGMQFAT